jgi:hypothetical protein
MRTRTLFAALVTSFAVADAGAAVLYKLVDPLGNTTFSDSVPDGFRGSVTRLDIETGSNIITPSQAATSVLRSPVDDRLLARSGVRAATEARLQQAEARVDAARAALEDARNNSRAEDWIYYRRNPTTGASRMPSEEYQARLDQLASNLVVAEAEYDALRRELR